LTGQCKFEGIYFVFFFPLQKKEERNPTHIAAHLQAPRADAQNQFLRQVSAEPNLFELCRTQQKSAKLKLAKELQFC
jgi:hypothetical protein